MCSPRAADVVIQRLAPGWCGGVVKDLMHTHFVKGSAYLSIQPLIAPALFPANCLPLSCQQGLPIYITSATDTTNTAMMNAHHLHFVQGRLFQLHTCRLNGDVAPFSDILHLHYGETLYIIMPVLRLSRANMLNFEVPVTCWDVLYSNTKTYHLHVINLQMVLYTFRECF